MAEKKSSPVVKMEFIVFSVLLLVLLIWASNKCSRTQAEYEVADTEAASDSTQSLIDSLTALTQQPAPQPAAPVDDGIRRDTMRGGNMEIIRERVVPLYILIDGVNMRSGPGTNYGIVDRFGLHDEVYFMNEVTDSLYEINLGSITPKAPWVKVRNKKGKSGWIYGACVDYYKYTIEVD